MSLHLKMKESFTVSLVSSKDNIIYSFLRTEIVI